MGKLFDTDIEGKSELNEVYRTYIEAGYELAALELDDQRVNLVEELRDAHEQWEQRRLNLERYEWRLFYGNETEDDKAYGDFEFHKELKYAKRRLTRIVIRLKGVESSLESFFTPPVQDKPPANWRCVLCKDENPNNYAKCQQLKDRAESYKSRTEHYKGVHDSARTKEHKLRAWLMRSTERQDKKTLKRLDWLKGRQQLTGPWYYLLAMLIVRKHVDTTDAAKFALLPYEKKRKARKDKARFWSATHDRLMNFRRVNEERAKANGREWLLPHDNHTLEVIEVEYDPEVRVTSDSYTLSEDAMIANIDYKASAFIRRVLERRSKMSSKAEETNMMRRERIKAVASKGERSTSCQ